MLILETEFETKGCVVRVTRKYSRIDRARDMKGLDEEEEEEEHSSPGFIIVVTSPDEEQ